MFVLRFIQTVNLLCRNNEEFSNVKPGGMGTGSFPWVKRPGRGADHPPPRKRRGHERVELYLYSPSGPSWPVLGRTKKNLVVRTVIPGP